MTAPFIHELDPLEELKQMRASDDPLEQLKATKRRPSVPGVAADATRVNPTPDTGEPGAGAKILGTIAATGRDIPGVEAAQAGVRALVRGQSYRDARNDIRTAEDAAPAPARFVARAGGGALAAATIPGGPALQGARYGVLQGLGQSDPDLTIKKRVDDAGLGGAVGGITGGIADNAGRIPWGGLAKVLIHPRQTAVKMVGGVIRDAIGEARAPVATSVAEAVVPSAEGFIGNGVGNLADATVNSGPKHLTTRRPSSPIIGAIPRAEPEGLINNPMDNVLEAVKAQHAGSDASVLDAVKQSRQPMYDAFSNEARAVDDATLPNVVKASERYRTESGALQRRAPNARYDWFAEQMAKRKQP